MAFTGYRVSQFTEGNLNRRQRSDFRPQIDQGVVVVLEYSGNQGNRIGMVNISRGTCGVLSDPRTLTRERLLWPIPSVCRQYSGLSRPDMARS